MITPIGICLFYCFVFRQKFCVIFSASNSYLILLPPSSFLILQSIFVQDSSLHVVQELLKLVICRWRTVLKILKYIVYYRSFQQKLQNETLAGFELGSLE